MNYSPRIIELQTPPADKVVWSCTVRIEVRAKGKTAFEAFTENPTVFKGITFAECKDWKVVNESG